MVTRTDRKSPDRSRTEDLMGRLERHYIVPNDEYDGGIFVPECGRNGAWSGGSASRCDALHVGFTSASGRVLTGHEVKVTRSDWLAELRKVGKADTWADQCHRWFLVVPTADIVQPGELPHGWGLMVPGSRTRMKILVEPVTREVTPSWDAVRSIMARLDTLQREKLAEVNRQINSKVAALVGPRVEQEMARQQMMKITPELREAREVVARFAEATGVELKAYTGYDPGELQATPEEFAGALRVVRAANDLAGMHSETARLVDHMEQVAASVKSLAEGLDAFRTRRR